MNMDIKQKMVQVFKKNMNGYSSASCYKYLNNLGIEAYKYYEIDAKNKVSFGARKGRVFIYDIKYLDKSINDIHGYLKRQNLVK